VLNDNAWVELVDRSEGHDVFGQLAYAPDGTLYYGALGSWGEIERTPNGRWRTLPLRPEITPEWVPATNFDKVTITAEATYFAGWNGVALRETASGRHTFFKIKEVAHIFTFGGRGFVSSRRVGVQTFDIKAGVLQQPDPDWRKEVIVDTATLSDGRLIGSTAKNTLVTFDGTHFSPWAKQLNFLWEEGITSIQALEEGGIAIAVQNKGLFLLSAQGELIAAYDLLDYQNIQQLATNEPGILWATTDAGILRIAYGCDAAIVDQRMGIPIKWPQVARWGGKTLITTNGKLYEANSKMPGAISQFTLVPNQPQGELWGIASNGPHLLVGNFQGVFAANAQGGFD
jgi:ligand-binding sensor domain-containing protein